MTCNESKEEEGAQHPDEDAHVDAGVHLQGYLAHKKLPSPRTLQ